MTGRPPRTDPGRRSATSSRDAREGGRRAERRGGGRPDAAARDAHARAARRGLIVLGALAALGSLQVVFMIGVELDRSLRHGASIESLERELADLGREAEGLRAVVRHADDAVYREQLARRQGFLYAGETRVVVLPGSSP